MTTSRPTPKTADQRPLVLTVWQFVRLMVRLEETIRSNSRRQALFDILKADWQILDQELERLRAEDFSAYSRMMMDHTVRFERLPTRAVEAAGQVLNEVANQLQRAANATDGDGRADLAFERRELQQLVRKLAPKLAVGGKKPVGTAKARKPAKRVGIGSKAKAGRDKNAARDAGRDGGNKTRQSGSDRKAGPQAVGQRKTGGRQPGPGASRQGRRPPPAS